ncbi:hypothetical protein JTE90_028929 [Oedothorax gibbosus]|uniref:Vps16 C-terminal domain-containing protein n=1 Tax=Oedothorax gibbosus TaxID=931172 RepID=A0AAV6VHN1_9ARAC|nr:hypothetical protein JTE90_028929 [Oedothorax gibbosus]
MYENAEGDVYVQSDDEWWYKGQSGEKFEDDTSASLSHFDHKGGGDIFHEELEKQTISKNSYFFESLSNTPRSEAAERSATLKIASTENLKKKGPINCLDTVTHIVLGLEYNLNPFKSLLEKQKLLKAAIHSHDGNAILVVVLFLKSSLKKSLFLREIRMQADAVNMYLSYLHETREQHELTDLLLSVRRPGDCAVLKYEDANQIPDPKRKLNVLQTLMSTYCQPGLVSRFISESVLEHCMCLEDYKVLMDHKVVSELCDDNILENLIGRNEISNSCIVDLLIFSILHFYNVSEISSISPLTIRDRYKVSSQKFQWCALRTLAAAKKYQDLEKLLLTKRWFGGMKLQSYVPYKTVLSILSKSDAPLEVLEKYINIIENESEKLTLAKKYKCNKSVIEILKKKRSKTALLEFQHTLPPDSIEYHIISNMLLSTEIKWKN